MATSHFRLQVAHDMQSLREVIEEVNGFSFRDSSTEIKASRFAPG
jgi:hypothetical protein